MTVSGVRLVEWVDDVMVCVCCGWLEEMSYVLCVYSWDNPLL